MKKTMLSLISILFSMMLFGGITMNYQLSNPVMEETALGLRVKMGGTASWGEPGMPDLPWFGVKLLLPLGHEASSITIERSKPVSYKLKGKLMPLQQQYPLSQKEIAAPNPPDPAIYKSAAAFPQKTDNGLNTQFLNGHPICFTAVSAFEYYPLQDELIFYQELSIKLETVPSARAQAALSLLKQDSFIAKRLKQSVHNEAPRYQDSDVNGIEYLMIVDAAKFSNWQPLVDYYEGRGMAVLQKAVGEIVNEYPGQDSQEKIRNYIIDMYQNNPLRFVLLGGDTDVIPHRGMYVNMGSGSQVDDDIPADMYYSCLDGNWNADNDQYWGETYEADLAPELAIGRICYNSDLEIANQIYKVVSYQMLPVESSIKSVLFLGEWLWEGPTWGGDYMDEMIGDHNVNGYSTVGVPSSWNIATLYDRTFNQSDAWGPSQVRPLLSNGPNLVNHLGHSATTYNMRLSNSQVSANSITNTGDSQNFSLYFTQGCYAGSFDNRETSAGSYTSDCITEKLTSIPTAAVGMISHSRYGWGMQGSTNGASQYFHRQYIDAIFGKNILDYGYTLVDSKIDNIPFILNQPVMYWVTYETNLFGCPALKIYTDTPRHISVNMPSQWLVGVNHYTIQSDAPGGHLILMKDNQRIFQTYADDEGTFTISLFNALTPGNYQVYINADNCYAYNSTVFVTASEMPYVICQDHQFIDEDGVYHTNEIVGVSTTVKNVGLIDQIESGTISLSSSSENIEIIQGTLSFEALAAGDSLHYENAFQIRIVGSFADKAMANLKFSSEYDGYRSESYGRITLSAPLLNLEQYSVLGHSSYIMPGDAPFISLQLENLGSGTAFSPVLMVFPNDPELSVDFFELDLPAIYSGESLAVPNAFQVQVSPDAIEGNSFSLTYMIMAENGNVVEGVFIVNVGLVPYTFEPDMQNWSSEQLSNQFVNQWHRSSSQNNTPGGTYSMKFGNVAQSDYAASSYGALISPPVQIAPNSTLRFYHRMDAEKHNTNTAYAWDGGLVKISVNDGNWQQIEPVGGYPYKTYNNPASPFATNTWVYSGEFDWTEAVFELGEISGSVRFAFIFGSDAYVGGEGWYIDDVIIESEPVSSQNEIAPTIQNLLFQNYPNPFNPETKISFQLKQTEKISLEIYNIKGQMVRRLADADFPGGKHTLDWNGRDDNGMPVASGMYFYRLKSSSGSQKRKMVLMK